MGKLRSQGAGARRINILKIFIYCFREFDEKPYFDALKSERDFSCGASPDYPSMETAGLARGHDAICTTVNLLDEALLKKFREIGVRFIVSRTIGYDHIDLNAAKALGFKVSHVEYESDAVTDFAIVLLLMGLRNMRQVLGRAAKGRALPLCGRRLQKASRVFFIKEAEVWVFCLAAFAEETLFVDIFVESRGMSGS